MVHKEVSFTLKDGRMGILRSPCEDNAAEMLRFITIASGETDFLMRYPEEFSDFTVEREKAILNGINEDPSSVMLVCFVDGKIAGNCQISFRTGLKDRHRASVAIALLEEFWSLGIGTKMFEEMIQIAKNRNGVRQMELDFLEGNSRARGLYEKMGFRITGVKADAIRLKDGTFLNEYMMVKRL